VAGRGGLAQRGVGFSNVRSSKTPNKGRASRETERLLEAFLEVADDGHGLTDGFSSPVGEDGRSAPLVTSRMRKRGILVNDVIDRVVRTKSRRDAGNGSFVELVGVCSDGELGGDLVNRERWLWKPLAPRSATRAGSSTIRSGRGRPSAGFTRTGTFEPPVFDTDLAQAPQSRRAHNLGYSLVAVRRQGRGDGDRVAVCTPSGRLFSIRADL